MRSPGINGEEELRGQPANPGSPFKMAVKKSVCVCVYFDCVEIQIQIQVYWFVAKRLKYKINAEIIADVFICNGMHLVLTVLQ